MTSPCPPYSCCGLPPTVLCPQLEAGIARHIQKLVGVKESVLPEDVSGPPRSPLPKGLTVAGGLKAVGCQREVPQTWAGNVPSWALVSSLDAKGVVGSFHGLPQHPHGGCSGGGLSLCGQTDLCVHPSELCFYKPAAFGVLTCVGAETVMRTFGYLREGHSVFQPLFERSVTGTDLGTGVWINEQNLQNSLPSWHLRLVGEVDEELER